MHSGFAAQQLPFQVMKIAELVVRWLLGRIEVLLRQFFILKILKLKYNFERIYLFSVRLSDSLSTTARSIKRTMVVTRTRTITDRARRLVISKKK